MKRMRKAVPVLLILMLSTGTSACPPRALLPWGIKAGGGVSMLYSTATGYIMKMLTAAAKSPKEGATTLTFLEFTYLVGDYIDEGGE